ncbi:MAG: stage III sporulation protein AF [Syntrophomonadaceae bacterium]|nr:stage III sporulation protein AF [Syntrophomonadaceae bacterium]MDD3024558.1 stage III sporulation protein AF [Syntrophomonadaceae bacterium]
MSTLAEIVKNILYIIILASFLEILLPDGGLKPFVRFAIGLFILISVLNPVLSLLFNEQQFEVKLWDYQANEEQSEEILKKGRDINQQITDGNSAAVKEKMQGQIASIAMLVPGVQELETRIDMGQEGTFQKLHIMVKTGDFMQHKNSDNPQVFSENQSIIGEPEKTEIKERILGLLRNLYGMQKTDIEIEFQGG